MNDLSLSIYKQAIIATISVIITLIRRKWVDLKRFLRSIASSELQGIWSHDNSLINVKNISLESLLWCTVSMYIRKIRTIGLINFHISVPSFVFLMINFK